MTSTTPQPYRFTVLYYKRTNKVHKHRGTSRQDGILSIAPPPVSSVRLLDNDVANAADDHDDDDLNDDDSEDEDVAAGKSYYKRRGKQKNFSKKSNKRSALQKKTSKSAAAVIIYSGVNQELAKRAADIQDDEEIVLSGQWECQIISKLLEEDGCGHDGAISTKTPISGAAHNNSSTATAAKIGTRKLFMTKPPQRGGLISRSRGAISTGGPSSVASSRARAPLHSVKLSNHDIGMKQKQPSYKLLGARAADHGLIKAPVSTATAIGHAAAVSNNSNNNAASLKSVASSSSSSAAAASGAAVASGGKVMKKDKNGEWYLDNAASSKHDDHDDAATTTTLKKTSSIPSSLVRAKGASSTLGAGLVRKRPLGSIAGGISSSSGGGGLLKRNMNINMMSGNHLKSTSTAALSNTKSTTSTAAPVSNNNNKNFFPGALGDKINIPNSIREVLRPHQREGIAFLWNCVTGVSVGLNHAIVRAREQSASSCSSSLSSMGSFDLEVDGMDDSDVEYDDCGVSSLQTNSSGVGGGAMANNKKKEGGDNPMPRGAVLADEMGLGKTLMTIATIFALHRRKRDRRFIVVCPSSLVPNWAKEFDKWIGKASQPKRVIVRNGNEEGLRKLRSFVPIKPNQSEVLILSYELFRIHKKVICNAAKIGLLVVDEGHRLKNTAGSQTLSALNSISAEARILISGTVIQNNLSEFFTLASFAVPGILGDLNTFRRLYERPMSRANQKNATSGQKEKGRQQSKLLDSITSTFVLRRTQKDVLKSILPPRQEILLFCRPTERQCQLYKNISNRASKSIGSIGGIEASNNPLMLLTEARKLCTHPSLLGEASDSSLELSGKMIVLSSLLDSIRQNNPTDKVVIISNFTSALTVIEDSILRKKNLPFVRLDGSTDNASRGPTVDSFNKRSIEHSFAFMLSSKAGGCGLNLIGANRLIMVDADWNPATDQQSMARIYRQGQTKPCFIYRLFTTGTVEEIIYQRQTQKGNLAKIANNGGSKKGSSTNASFTKEELRDCFTLKEGCKCDTKTKLGNKWSDYNGADSLRDDGFADAPLLGVCEDKAGTLSFVHVVDEDANPVDPDDDDNDAEKAAAGVDEDDDDSSLGLGSESSSEEEEFEG